MSEHLAIMNIVNWTKAFENVGAELVTLKLPMIQSSGATVMVPHQNQPITLGRILSRIPPKPPKVMYIPFTIAEERHLEFKEMTIHSMYGKFYCPNPRCNSKRWNSTSCNTSMKYRYDELKQRGEIIIENG